MTRIFKDALVALVPAVVGTIVALIIVLVLPTGINPFCAALSILVGTLGSSLAAHVLVFNWDNEKRIKAMERKWKQ